jgi:hypothetical protein
MRDTRRVGRLDPVSLDLLGHDIGSPRHGGARLYGSTHGLRSAATTDGRRAGSIPAQWSKAGPGDAILCLACPVPAVRVYARQGNPRAPIGSNAPDGSVSEFDSRMVLKDAPRPGDPGLAGAMRGSVRQGSQSATSAPTVKRAVRFRSGAPLAGPGEAGRGTARPDWSRLTKGRDGGVFQSKEQL